MLFFCEEREKDNENMKRKRIYKTTMKKGGNFKSTVNKEIIYIRKIKKRQRREEQEARFLGQPIY